MDDKITEFLERIGQLEAQLEALDGEFLVVDKDGSDGHAVVPMVLGGLSGMMLSPPPVTVPTAAEADAATS